MRMKLMALTISLVGWIAFLGCNTEAGTREDDTTRPNAQGEYQDQSGAATSDQSRATTTDQTGATSGAATGSLASSFGPYDQWDSDKSGDVSKTEFESKFSSMPAWSQWDQNGDQNLDQNEAANVQWKLWDRNGDDQVADDEWGDGTDMMGIKSDYKDADADHDGTLSKTEFTQWFQGKAWSEWDQDGDGKVAVKEAADAVYGMWDHDDDNKIDQDEFDDALEA